MDINNVTGVRNDITEMLSKLREVSNKSKVFSEEGGGISATNSNNSFVDIMSSAKNVISNVSQSQDAMQRVNDAYTSGDPHVSMSQVVMATEKSKLAFEGLMTVRNKLLEAYKEIMSMQV